MSKRPTDRQLWGIVWISLAGAAFFIFRAAFTITNIQDTTSLLLIQAFLTVSGIILSGLSFLFYYSFYRNK